MDEDADVVHIVMELHRSGGLFNKIVEKSRQSRSSRSLGGSILDIVHSDINPENILFTEQDDSDSDATRMSSVRLIDFGSDLNDVSRRRHAVRRWWQWTLGVTRLAVLDVSACAMQDSAIEIALKFAHVVFVLL